MSRGFDNKIKELVIIWDEFMADCKREMWRRKMTNGDLAKLTGYTTSSINAFFADLKSRDKSSAVGEAISRVLGVELR